MAGQCVDVIHLLIWLHVEEVVIKSTGSTGSLRFYHSKADYVLNRTLEGRRGKVRISGFFCFFLVIDSRHVSQGIKVTISLY